MKQVEAVQERERREYLRTCRGKVALQLAALRSETKPEIKAMLYLASSRAVWSAGHSGYNFEDTPLSLNALLRVRPSPRRREPSGRHFLRSALSMTPAQTSGALPGR